MGVVLLTQDFEVKDILKDSEAVVVREKDIERQSTIKVRYPDTGIFEGVHYIHYKEMLYKLIITNKDHDSIEAEGEAFYYTLGTDKPKTLNFESVSAEFSIGQALDGTDWEVGVVEITNLRTTKAKDETTLEVLGRIERVFNGELNFRVVMGKQGIEHLYVDLLERLGGEKGHRYEVGYNIQDYSHEVDQTSVITAMVPRGESQDLDEDGDPVPFGIEDIEWSTENGDPVDKPLGQDFIGDPEALEKYGIVDKQGEKQHIFKLYDSEAQTPESLITSTWNALQRRNKPTINTEANVIDLKTEEPVELGDTVAVIFKDERLQARVIRIEYHDSQPENTNVEIGEFRQAITEELEELRRQNLELKRKEGIYNRSALFEMEEQETGTEYLLDIGEKNIVIVGDTNFYWDGSGLFAINPTDIQNYIRFDKDGLRFTEDGGENWTLALGYNGLNVSGTTEYAELDSRITVNEDAIDLRVTETVFDDRVGAVETDVSGLDSDIHGEDGIDSRVTKNEGLISTNADEIALRVTQTTYNEDQEDVNDAITSLEAGETQINDELTSLSGQITTNADNISAVVSRVEVAENKVTDNESSITALDDSIEQRVSSKIDDYDEGIKEHISSQITQEIDSIEFNFEQASGDIQDLKEDMETVNSTFTFTPEYFEIAKSDSPFKMRLDEERMEFLDGTNTVASISNRRMFITKAELTESLRIGNHLFERYDEEITLVKWVGDD